MIGNGFHHLMLIWIFMSVNIFAEENHPNQPTNIEETKKFQALKISNTEAVGVLPSNQEIILKFGNAIPDSYFNNLVVLKHLTWINGHLEQTDLEILNKLDLETLAFIKTNGNISLSEHILKNLTQLKELIVHQNDQVILEANSLGSLFNLQVLSADNQSLESISSETFKHCEKLQYLSLTKGFLGDIDPKAFQHLKNLISITLSEMSLKYLRKNTFSNLRFLYLIDLSGNHLVQITGEEFLNLPKLEILNLKNNYLHSFNAEYIMVTLPILNILNLSENKFSCAEKHRLHENLMKRNISSFEERDLNRCHFSTGQTKIFSA